jgi:hypothetical protein
MDASQPQSDRPADAGDVMDQAKASGAPTFTFNPDASPEEKARQLKEVSDADPNRG